MQNDEIIKKIDEMNAKIDEMQRVVQKLNSYFKWTAIITIALFVLPLIALMFAIPSYLSQMSAISGF